MGAVGLAATGYIVLWGGIALATGRLHADYGNLINAYLAIFLASLLVCAAAVRTPAFNAPLNRYLNGFAELLSRRGAFTSDVRQEIPKFALIRILFGFCLAVRAFWIIYYLQPSDWHHPLIWGLAVAHLVASVLVMTGTLTTAAFVYLVIVQWTYGDWTLGTYTLGNYIAAMLAFILIFANAGAHYSVDALLLRGTNEVSSLAKRGYYKGGITSENVLQVSKFLTLLMYWCVCLYSLSMHVNESAWMSGNAGPLLLSNRFMSTYGAEFQHFFELGTWAVWLGRIALWSMLPWYLFVIPFVILGGVFRKYVLIWSILFFALSEFVLQLGSLATFEFLMLAAIFWTPDAAKARSLHVLYDDQCNLCDRTVRFIRAVDWFGRIELKPLSQNMSYLPKIGITYDEALADLHGVDTVSDAAPFKGYELYVALARRIVLLWPIYPVLLAGRYLGGRALYRMIADRRIRWFGVCQIPAAIADAGTAAPEWPKLVGVRDPIAIATLHVTGLAAIFILATPLPYVGSPSPQRVFGGRVQRALTTIADSAFYYGVGPINVFNSADLRLAENWFTLSETRSDGTRVLLPIFSKDGRRLSMHRSDRIYFGYTLAFRRNAIGKKGCLFDRYKSSIEYLAQAGKSKNADTITFVQYHQPLPDLRNDEFKAAPVSIVCSVTF